MPFSNLGSADSSTVSGISFKPVRGPMPLSLAGTELTKQVQDYGKYEIQDDLVLPDGFTYDVIAAWGDKVGDSRFGYNNDYLSFVETGKDEGFLTVNFEYISSKPWTQTYNQVIGKSLPFEKLEAALKPAGQDGINAFALADNNPTKAMIQDVSKEALTDLGIGVISIRREADGKWVRTNSKADRRLTGISGLEDGRYLKATEPGVAVFRKKGKALKADTPVNPDLPSVHAGGMITLLKRPEGGIFKAQKDADIAAFKQKFKTLGNLYTGKVQEKQGAILIDAHFAANAISATCTARPEDTEIAPDGSLFITFTSGTSSSSDGGPDLRIFKGRDGKAYEYGWIMRLVEDGNNSAAMTFRWKILALGGEPAEGGAGFANPDNLLIDKAGHVWMVTDMSTDKLNTAAPKGRLDQEGKPISQSNLRGVFGNNAVWFIPTSGANAGNAYMFGYGPMECETTGPCFTADEQTLFLSVQHPGEINGTRQGGASGYEDRKISMRTSKGEEFMQTRRVPIGSNWPAKTVNAPPKPAVVAIWRQDAQSITTAKLT